MATTTRRTYSVRVRILAVILALTALGLAVAGGIAAVLQRNLTLSAVDASLRQHFETVQVLATGRGSSAEPSDPAADPDQPQSTGTQPPAFANTEELVYEAVRITVPPLSGGTVGLVDGRARYVSGVATTLDLNEGTFLEHMRQVSADGGAVIGTETLEGRELRYLAVPLRVDGSTQTGLFVVAIDTGERLADLRSAMTVYLWTAIVVVLVVGLAGWFVAGRLLLPLRQLRNTAARITAARITAGALDERIPVSGNDDVSDLTRTINDMIARLDDAFTAQRRVMNDVRHELATPLTIVRGHIDLIDSDDPADVRHSLGIVSDELERMSGLLTQITELADAERAAAHRPRPVDIGALTRTVFEKMRVLGDHDWQLGTVAEGTAVVDPGQLTQAWLQLADNAAKHCPPGTRITVGSSIDGDRLRCWVADAGPGVPEAARERIFQRFGRTEASRGTAGSGLGLAIVQALALAHGGRVELDTAVGRGSTFTLVLPTRPDTSQNRSPE